MRNSRRYWRAMLIAAVAAVVLSGCYYDPCTGYYYSYPPYPYLWGYPYGYGSVSYTHLTLPTKA